jgi:hypothetical protein
MDSNISSRSSSPEPQTSETKKIYEKVADSLKTTDIPRSLEKEKKKNGRNAPRTEKQMEALRSGMLKLKENREMRAKEKEDRKQTNVELRKKGLPLLEAPIKVEKVAEIKPAPVVVVKQRKVRIDKGVLKSKDPQDKAITKREFEEMRSMLKPIEKEVVREVPVIQERVVEREKVLSGSELLNKIFFNK